MKLNLVGAGPDGEKLTTVGLPSGSATVDWNHFADLTALTGTPLPPTPWTLDDDGTLVGGPALKGVLWSHLVSYGGQPTSGAAPIEDRSVAGLTSAYAVGDHKITRKTHWRRIPRYKPHYWWEYCSMCEVELGQKWLEVVHDRAAVVAVVAFGPDGGTDVTGAVDRTAVRLLDAGTHVNAAEPELALQLAGVARRAVVLRAGTLEVIGALGTGATGVVGESFTAPTQPLEAGEAVALSYAATRGELFAVRQAPGKPVVVRSYALAMRRWRAVPQAGVALGTPLAASFSPHEQALYLLDRGAGTTVRLVRISLADGVATIASPRLLDGSFSSLSLGFTAAATLLVVGADPRTGQTSAAHLQLGAPVLLRDRATLPRASMVGGAFENAAGVLFLVATSEGFEARTLAPAAFQPVNAPVNGPVW